MKTLTPNFFLGLVTKKNYIIDKVSLLMKRGIMLETPGRIHVKINFRITSFKFWMCFHHFYHIK